MIKQSAHRLVASALLSAGLLLSGGIASAAGTDLVVNGGFETGDFSGWTETPLSGASVFNVDGSGPHNGLYSAYFGALDPYDTISQALTTTIGTAYTISFSLDSAVDASYAAGFVGAVDGVNFVSLSEADGPLDFTTLTYQFTATSTSSLLSFSSYNTYSFYTLDDVTVTPVPEPSTYALMTLGLVGVAALARRRRSASAAAQQ